jgi:multidrug resistance efflux pump
VPNPSTHTNRRRILMLAVLMVGCLAAGGQLLSVALRGDAQTSTNSSSAPALRQIVAFGNVEVEDRVRKMSPMVPSGVISEVLVKEGELVSAGAILVRLDDTMARRRMDQAKADVDQAKAVRDEGLTLPERHRLELASAQYAVNAAVAIRNAAKISLQHKQEKLESKTIGLDEVAAAQEVAREAEEALRIKEGQLQQLRLVDPMAKLRELEAQVTKAEAVLAEARAALKQYALTAPTAGTVMQINVAVGDTVGAAPLVPAVLFCPVGPRVVKAEVEQAFAALVRVGQTTTVEDDAHAAGKWTGRVKWVADMYSPPRPVALPDPNQASDVRTLSCTIELDPNQPPLKINQRVLVTIDVPGK